MMGRNHRFLAILASITLCFGLIQPQPASAQFVVSDPVLEAKAGIQEYHDTVHLAKAILTESHTMKMTIQNAIMLARQLQELRLKIQELKTYPRETWAQTRADVAALHNIIRQGQFAAIAAEVYGNNFKRLYPDYVPPADFNMYEDSWFKHTDQAFEAELHMIKTLYNQDAPDVKVVDAEKKHVETASGPAEVAKASAVLAAQTVTQLEKLQHLQQAQSTAEANYYLQHSHQDESNQQVIASWLAGADHCATK